MYRSKGSSYLLAGMVGLCVYMAISAGIKSGFAGAALFVFFAVLWLVLLLWNIKQIDKRR